MCYEFHNYSSDERVKNKLLVNTQKSHVKKNISEICLGSKIYFFSDYAVKFKKIGFFRNPKQKTLAASSTDRAQKPTDWSRW